MAEFGRCLNGGCAVAILAGYFDESGITAGSPITLVAGIVTDYMLWTRIERPWKEHLRTTGVSWFHAFACEHGEGEFAHVQRPLRDSLNNGLSKTLAGMEGQCFGAAIHRDDWHFAPADVRRRFLDNPYYFCVEFCLQQVAKWSAQYEGGEPVALVFSKHEEYGKKTASIHELYQRGGFKGLTGIGSLTVADPRLVIPLQAADMLAYELYQYVVQTRNEGRESPPTRTAMRNFEDARRLAIDLQIHDGESLSKLVVERP